jgi:hypothetical protein
MAVDAQAGRRQRAPGFAAPIHGGGQAMGEFESCLVPPWREASLARGRRVRHRILSFCAWATKRQRMTVRIPHRRGTGYAAPVTSRGRRAVVGIPHPSRRAVSSAYLQDVTRGHLCVQSRSHFSLRLLAFDAWLRPRRCPAPADVRVDNACCRASADCPGTILLNSGATPLQHTPFRSKPGVVKLAKPGAASRQKASQAISE